MCVDMFSYFVFLGICYKFQTDPDSAKYQHLRNLWLYLVFVFKKFDLLSLPALRALVNKVSGVIFWCFVYRMGFSLLLFRQWIYSNWNCSQDGISEIPFRSRRTCGFLGVWHERNTCWAQGRSISAFNIYQTNIPSTSTWFYLLLKLT